MDRTEWRIISSAVDKIDRFLPRPLRRRRYSDRLIAKLYIWSVIHDRPRSWVCVREHYDDHFRPRRLPSISRFSRRLRTRRLQTLLRLVNDLVVQRDRPAPLAFFDGKPLPVSESTRDPEAKTGRGNGRFSRGYKLHALAAADGRILACRVRPLNEGEPRIARRLVGRVAPHAFVLADTNYDSNRLYQALAKRQAQLFTPQKGRNLRRGRRRPMCEARRRVVDLWDHEPQRSQNIYRLRGTIERIFSALSSFAGGLAPLPAWVRRLRRVRLWVTAKLIYYHTRLLTREGRTL